MVITKNQHLKNVVYGIVTPRSVIAHVGMCIIISVNHHHIVINKSFITLYIVTNKSFITLYEDFLIDYAHWNL